MEDIFEIKNCTPVADKWKFIAYKPVVNPVGRADAKLLPAPRLLGVSSDRIGVISVFAFIHHKHTQTYF